MGNYKPYGHSFITAGGQFTPAKIKMLYTHVAGATTAISLKDASTYLDYQVPTGKKYHAIGIVSQKSALAGFITWYEDATADAGSGTIKGYSHVGTELGTEEWPADMTYTAGKFITEKADVAFCRAIYLLGEELDA